MAVVRAQERSPYSSSTCRSLYTYDVFLSFRGEDTRTNFTDHLYAALVDKGIRTFRDYDEIEKGESLKPELEKAIKESRISLIVFSKNYATSRWCLDELVMILECRKINSRHVVLPVFYDVSPSEVRKQTGTIGEVFDRRTTKRRSKLQELKKFTILQGTRIIEGLTLDMRRTKKDDNIARKLRYDKSLNKASPLISICSFFNCFSCFLLGQEISPALRNESLDLSTDAFEKMERLRLLKLNYTQLDGWYDNFPKKLIWLCWHGFPSKYMPIELSLENLVALDLRHSKLEEVWAGPKFLGSLKILNLSYSKRLVKTPNFLGVPNLERLILKGCVRLIEICESIEFLEELDLLDLTDCKNLRKLPRNMYKLGSLEALIISGCSALFAGGLGIGATSTTIGQGRWWCTSLLLPWVPQLGRGSEILWASLPHSLSNLSLAWCNLSDDSLPSAFSNLSGLKYLDLSYNSFCSLPDCIKSLSSLHWLSLHHCRSLNSILGLPSNLRSLNLEWCDSLRKITFQSTPYQLEETYCFDCDRLVEVDGILKREPVGEVDGRIIKNWGIDIKSIEKLKGSYEFGIFSTFIPGGEIPSCFSERKKGSSMPFTVSLVPKFRVQHLIICSVYVFSGRGVTRYPFAIKINNRTKDLSWVYCPMYYGCPGEDEEMTWLSQWNFRNKVEGGDKIVVSVFLSEMFEVKECGIKIVYKEEGDGVVSDDNYNKTFHWNEVVGRDLSRLELSTRAYFLCRKLKRAIYPDVVIDIYRIGGLLFENNFAVPFAEMHLVSAGVTDPGLTLYGWVADRQVKLGLDLKTKCDPLQILQQLVILNMNETGISPQSELPFPPTPLLQPLHRLSTAAPPSHYREDHRSCSSPFSSLFRWVSMENITENKIDCIKEETEAFTVVTRVIKQMQITCAMAAIVVHVALERYYYARKSRFNGLNPFQNKNI
ncbi:hypothetical protein LguiB_021719 [Lonicera macranthoides]